MKHRGFTVIYLLPIFLGLIILSFQIISSAQNTNKLSTNFIGKEYAYNIAEIGISHGFSIYKKEKVPVRYYINFNEGNIELSNVPNNEGYTHIEIKVIDKIENNEVTFKSTGVYNKFNQVIEEKHLVPKNWYNEDEEENLGGL